MPGCGYTGRTGPSGDNGDSATATAGREQRADHDRTDDTDQPVRRRSWPGSRPSARNTSRSSAPDAQLATDRLTRDQQRRQRRDRAEHAERDRLRRDGPLGGRFLDRGDLRTTDEFGDFCLISASTAAIVAAAVIELDAGLNAVGAAWIQRPRERRGEATRIATPRSKSSRTISKWNRTIPTSFTPIRGRGVCAAVPYPFSVVWALV